MNLKSTVLGLLLVLSVACAPKSSSLNLETLDPDLATAIENLSIAVASQNTNKVNACFHSGGERFAKKVGSINGGLHPSGILYWRMVPLAVNQTEENFAEVKFKLSIYSSNSGRDREEFFTFRKINGKWLAGGDDLVKTNVVTQP